MRGYNKPKETFHPNQNLSSCTAGCKNCNNRWLEHTYDTFRRKDGEPHITYDFCDLCYNPVTKTCKAGFEPKKDFDLAQEMMQRYVDQIKLISQQAIRDPECAFDRIQQSSGFLGSQLMGLVCTCSKCTLR